MMEKEKVINILEYIKLTLILKQLTRVPQRGDFHLGGKSLS